MLLRDADVILDGCDNFATRLAVSDAATQLRTPLVTAAVGQFEGQLGVWRGWESRQPCYRCLVGNDPGQAGQNCAEDGIVGALTGILGSMAALEAIRAIVPFGDDSAGKLLMCRPARQSFPPTDHNSRSRLPGLRRPAPAGMSRSPAGPASGERRPRAAARRVDARAGRDRARRRGVDLSCRARPRRC